MSQHFSQAALEVGVSEYIRTSIVLRGWGDGGWRGFDQGNSAELRVEAAPDDFLQEEA